MNTELKSYEDFTRVLLELTNNGMEDDIYYIQYVMMPYINTLGYDVFDMGTVTRMYNGDTFKIKGTETAHGDDINFIFSLNDYRDRISDREGVRSYVLIDKETKSITLYYYVLDEWYAIYETRLMMEDEEDITIESTNLVDLNKVVTKSMFQRSYSEIGEQLFTGSVVDSLLANGELDNRFIRQAIVDEITRPDKYMVRMLANKLTEYSTQETEWIEDMLGDITSTQIIAMIEEAIRQDEIDITVRAKPQPAPTAKKRRPKKQSEVKTNISHKSDRLKEAGFSTEDIGKGSTPTPKQTEQDLEEEYKEPEEVDTEEQEDEYDLGGLRNQLENKDTDEEEETSKKEDVSSTGEHDISSFFDV